MDENFNNDYSGSINPGTEQQETVTPVAETAAPNPSIAPEGNPIPAPSPAPAAGEYASSASYYSQNPYSVRPTYPPYYSAPAAAPTDGGKSKKKKKEKKGIGAGGIVAIALCCSLLGGAVGSAGAALMINNSKEETAPANSQVSQMFEGERTPTVLETNAVDTSKVLTQAELYAQNVNSVVGITTSITTNYWGYKTTAAASGSGFIITEDGYILTNHHVIENSNSIKVALYNGETYKAEIVGYDESNDLAVIKIDAKGLTPAILGSSDALNVGDEVVAIGNPLGELTFSLTSGYVSALDREITLSSNVTMDLIQTDCAINSGNSGGPLFNMYGEVIGITNAKYSGNGSSGEASIDNIGFAIPIDNVRSIFKSIIENGYVSKPYIGVSVADVSSETQSYGLPAGAAVKEIVEDSPAEQAGLEINDIITEANGKEIKSKSDLVDMVKSASVGDVLKLKVYRQGQTIDIDITVSEKIQSAKQDEDEDAESQATPEGGQQQEGQPSNPWDGWDIPDWFFRFGF